MKDETLTLSDTVTPKKAELEGEWMLYFNQIGAPAICPLPVPYSSTQLLFLKIPQYLPCLLILGAAI